jgi:4-aminobutyrate aminotransferase
MRRDRLDRRSAGLGDALRDRLAADLIDVPHVGEVRGLGLLIGIELVRDRESREPDTERCAAVRRRAFEGGVVVGSAGRYDNVVKLSPPLTIDEGELDRAVGVVIEAIGAAA